MPSGDYIWDRFVTQLRKCERSLPPWIWISFVCGLGRRGDDSHSLLPCFSCTFRPFHVSPSPSQLPVSHASDRSGNNGGMDWKTGMKVENGTKSYEIVYRDEINSLQIQLSSTQAGPGRAVKEQQEQNSLTRTKNKSHLCTVVETSAIYSH